MDFLCTATAFELTPTAVHYLTAAHCVMDPDRALVWQFDPRPIFLSDDSLPTRYFPVKPVRVGSPSRGLDFAILEGVRRDTVIVPLGDDRKESAHVSVTNIAAVGGVGKIRLTGYVALMYSVHAMGPDMAHLWAGYMLLDLLGGDGSSGSAIISNDTGAIIGIMIGHEGPMSCAMPISKMFHVPDGSLVQPK